MGIDWLQLLTAAVGGGFIVKLLDILYHEIRRYSDDSQSVKHFVDEHLDPLLKIADELVGKLRSLADEDFKTLRHVEICMDRVENDDFSSLAFLIAKLWANIEILRHESLFVSIVKDERGRHLQNFIDCMESRGVRIVNRISQRAIGELMLTRHKNGSMETVPFIEFIHMMETNDDAKRWLLPLVQALSRMNHTSSRQRLLQYGVVVHAMIDTLDPKHEVTRDRPSYPNKLSKKSWSDLKYRVFGRYLKFVSAPVKYLGPPKKGGPKKG